ncbi:pentatricopeptide repeat-containing protein At4g01990, mitochondrial-like [Magnolia sinica]|uniref:pentatricopeptide repeat-containing protein At4g01990, mitochondrial-like n=1 Tax=Magnolia sinica TaxID=86752 RepID=UPI002659777F|nr:pentatricopeptide repeat-containing protein At4g01990, mitochondrial-like [Magnolia sinica]
MAKNPSRALLYARAATRRLCTDAVMTETAAESKVAQSPSSSSSLYRRLSGLGDASSGTVTKTLNKWVREGKSVKKYEIEKYVKELRKYKRYNQALELMEWLESRGTNLSYSDYAIRLDLLSKTKGITEAEKYFTSLSEPAKNHLTYGALLNAYCVEKMLDKAMALLDKMKELNFASTSLIYNNIMSLYMRLHQPEKIPLLFQEMKAEKISPNAFTYNVLMNSYASLKDIEAVERVVEEMKEEGNVCCDWTTHSNLAAIYVEAGNFDKADAALKGLEKTINRRDRQAFHFLISLYAHTCNLAEVKRVWESLKSTFPKTTNLSYLVMLQALAKLGDFNALGKCFEEWELGCVSYDVRLVNVLISSYLRRDMIEEAKSLYESTVVKGPGPNFRTLEMFIEFYLKNDQIDLAKKHFETAVSKAKDDEWQPSQEKVRAFLKHFEESKDVDGAEEFYKKLKKVNCLDLEVYSSLLRTYIAAGKMEPLMRQRMKMDEIKMNSGTEELLGSVCPE